MPAPAFNTSPALPGLGVPYAVDHDHAPAFWNADFLWVVLAGGAQTNGALALLWELGPKGAGPPPHWHDQDEYFYVVRGRVSYSAGDQVLTAGPGSYVFVPRGTVHSFRVDSDEAELLNLYTPAGFERTIFELAEPAPARTLPPRGRKPTATPEQTARVFREVGMHQADGPDPLGRQAAVGPNFGGAGAG